jgi:hypothetical protein
MVRTVVIPYKNIIHKKQNYYTHSHTNVTRAGAACLSIQNDTDDKITIMDDGIYI